MTWRSKQVEFVLESSSQVLVQKPIEISIPRVLWMLIADRKLLMVGGGKRLKDVMPADLHARFDLQRSKVTDEKDKWERYRPIIAAAFLQQAAFHQVNLSMRLDLGAALRVLAKKHGVRIEEVKVAGVSDMLEGLKTMSAATERTCVEASLSIIESGLPRLVDRAQAWAVGDVERIKDLSELKEVDACRTRTRRRQRGVRCDRAHTPDLAGHVWKDIFSPPGPPLPWLTRICCWSGAAFSMSCAPRDTKSTRLR